MVRDNRRLLRTGIIGAIITALCCLTPVLVVMFGFLGLSAITGYLDYVLVPVFLLFIALTGYAVYRRRHAGNVPDQRP